MDRGAARLLGCFALWSAGVVAACNSIAGLDADYELAEGAASVDSGDGTSSGATSGGTGGTSGGTSGTSGTSGGTSGTSGGTSDAEPDAPGDADSGTPDADTSDAGGDAADTADATVDGSTRLCPLQGALICDDFEDQTSAPNFGWDDREALGGTPTVGLGFGFGGSRGLRALGNPADSPENSAKVLLYRELLAAQFPQGSTLTLRLRFNVTQADIEYAAIAVFQFAGGFEYGLAVHNNPNCPQGPTGRICVDENNVTSLPPTLQNARAIELGTWYSAEIRLSRNASDQYSGSVVLKGNPDVTLDTLNATQGNEPTSLQVRVGMFYTNDEDDVNDVRIDDVTVVRTGP